MKRFCVFCGERPQSKTREHIIPQWLIKMTGDPNRIGNFGLDMRKTDENLKLRQFSFSQLCFPACNDCNGKFGNLEDLAKPILIKLLNDDYINDYDLSLLLDWFDKVRIGLWLGFHLLDKNTEGIIPKFHIYNRIGTKDRMIIIGRTSGNDKHLSFCGPSLFSFKWLPCVIGLAINNVFMVNASAEYLLARRLGFPFPAEKGISLGMHEPDLVYLSPGLEHGKAPPRAACRDFL